jgi:hypothetical protein
MIIRQPSDGNALIAVIEDYEGPVPRVGEYLFHPPLHDAADYNGGIAGQVKTVTWALHGRPQSSEPHFVARPHPVVEVAI